ncbi:hypothetical protein A2V94_07155 [Candidatus Atribacteria bacterium RBG_16_35_8]|nr:MAG: hypothetical protein A2V94_07155 [Candidatus Atribacteria bacterium RBG_16_35_8]
MCYKINRKSINLIFSPFIISYTRSFYTLKYSVYYEVNVFTLNYLNDLVLNRCNLYLYGCNPHIVNIRTHSHNENWEQAKTAWFNRKFLKESLMNHLNPLYKFSHEVVYPGDIKGEVWLPLQEA